MLLERIDELPLAPPRPARQPERAARLDRRQRIDRLKDELVTAADYAAWAATLPEDTEAEPRAPPASASSPRSTPPTTACSPRPGTLDFGDLVAARLPRCCASSPHVRARLGRALPARARRRVPGHELRPGPAAAAARRASTATSSRPATTTRRSTASAARRRRTCATSAPSGRTRRSCGSSSASAAASAILDAARAVVEPDADRIDEARCAAGAPRAARSRFWRCANERAQAQAVAAEVERLVARDGVAPEDICVLVRSVKSEGQAVAVALEERAVPYRLAGAAAFFQRAEVRDLLAWLRLLADPGDAGAVVRALARPPVELRSVDLARCTQIARRRKLDMVGALGARARVAADPARGARAHPRLPEALPRAPPARWTRRAPTSSCTA